jgi:probable DNA repair protein
MSDEALRADDAHASRERLTLTATDRLARTLREDANLDRSRSGAPVWEAPRIAGFSRWLIDTWTAGWPDAQLLSGTQELVLWRDAVERDELSSQLLAPLAAAREARRADQLLRRHAIDLESTPAWSDEHQVFRRWRRQVARRLQQNHWLTSADLAGEVARLIGEGSIAVPEAIDLVGFAAAALPASEQAVIDALIARGTQVQWIAASALRPRVQRCVLPDPESQWRFVCADLRERLRTADPPPRVVVALADPDGARELGESVLRGLLAPWAMTGEGPAPWRWERGRRLSEHPQADALLALLQLRPEDNAPELASRVLLSAALWTESERALTARADEALRDRGWPRIRLARVIEAVHESLRPRFEELARRIAQAPSRALPSEWGAHFRALADALGWPGSEALDSSSYQAVKALRGLFDRLGTLDAQLGRVPQASARDWLSELARGAAFAPRVEHAQPVLITSLDEAAAMSCDLLYVLDASAAQVPVPARPTAFVAAEALRAAGVPEAAPETWLARTQAQVARLLGGCAPEVYVCVPAVDPRGAPQQPSTLFGAADAWTRVEPARSIGTLESALTRAAPALEWPDRDIVPPVDETERTALRADSGLFRAWFESPFFAFCRYRLGVEPLAQPPRGLDARVQGTLVHRALEDLWGELRDSAGLAAIDDDALSRRIHARLDARLAALLPATEFGAVTRAIERARAHDVVLQWLRHERTRIDPFHVERCELEARPVVASLPLSLRLDRVDRVETPLGERWLVIDYKTGREADQRGWRIDQLREPQLPLYASHAATLAAGIPQVDGICFGHLKDGHPALVARTNWRKLLRSDPPADTHGEWNEDLVRWRGVMEQAARGFLDGEAWLDPRVGARSYYADLLALTHALPDDEASA